MDCPTCDRRFIWRDAKFLRCISCGMWCPAKPEDDEEETNQLIGDWSDEEVAKLELATQRYCDTDFVFFKGRRVWTAWRQGQKNVRVLMGRTLSGLLKWL